jgi:lysophospholipase L1-like esterase
MAWPNILSRKLDRPVINLGFSGNGQLEKEVIDLIKEIEAKIFVLDCLPNMVSTRIDSLELEQRMISAVKNLRFKHPSTPILITHHAGYTEASLIPERKKLYEQANIVADKCYSMLKIEGFQNIFLLKKEEINLGIDDLVDGTHPSDLGMMKYADAYEKIIRTILNEPIGPLKTQIPSRQRREPNSYEWEQRHDEFLKLNKTEKTKIVFLGNSITHNWGGKPHNDRIKGEDSWQKYLDPLAARNFGMGWDRIENVLWRVHHDELDGISPEKIIVNIGTNNLHINSNQEIIEGLKLLIKSIKLKQPAAEIYLIGIYPRQNTEERIKTINQEIQKMCTASEIKYLNIGKVLLQNADNINETLFSDGLHPNHLGYEKLGNELIKHLNR